MSYTIETIGGFGIGDVVRRYVPCVFLGPGTLPSPRTTWRAEASFDQARRDVLYMAHVGNLAEPMWSGWVLLDGPNLVAPNERAQNPNGPTAWRIW